jgi:hypothetical protein
MLRMAKAMHVKKRYYGVENEASTTKTCGD